MSISKVENYASEQGVVKSLGTSVIDALEGVANWIGLGDRVKTIIRKWTNNPDEAQMSNVLSQMISAAESKGSSALANLQTKLYKIQGQTGSSQLAKQAISKALAKTQTAYNKAKSLYDKMGAMNTVADTQLSAAKSSSAGDIAHGKQRQLYEDAKSTASSASGLADQIANIEKEV